MGAHGALPEGDRDVDHANVIAAVNAALELRRTAPSDPAGLLDKLAS
jgi:hypothetical protein